MTYKINSFIKESSLIKNNVMWQNATRKSVNSVHNFCPSSGLTRNILLAVIAGSFLAACSSGGSNATGGVTPVLTASPLSIDNAGTVPVIGNNPTSSIIYVHNNSNVTISGIKYSAELNVGSGSFVNENSAGLCAEIKPGQSCPLSFTTPQLSTGTEQGSALVKAGYTLNGKDYQFSRTISFERLTNDATRGVLFNSGVQLTSSDNPTAYGVVYLYGSGKDKIYTVNSLTSSNSGVKIINGDISGKQLQSNAISVVEIMHR